MTTATHLEPQYLQFLTLWFQQALPGELMEVRPLHKRPDRAATRQTWHLDAVSAGRAVALAVKNGDDVYIGALARRREGGTEADVASFRWVFADLDYGTTGHARPAPFATRTDALARVRSVAERVGSAPTMVIDTGGGFHAWWALRETAPEAAWRDAMARVVHALDGDPNATDAPRILRVPGTMNYKTVPNGPTRRVQIVDAHPRFIDLARLLALPEAPAAQTPPPRRASPTRADADRPFDLANEVPVYEVFDWLGIAMHREGQRVYCACPVHGGSNANQMVVGGDANGASCFGDCAAGGPGRFYTNVDVTAAVRHVDPKAAVDLLAERFNFQGFKGRVYAFRRPGEAATATEPPPWEEPIPLVAEKGDAPAFPQGVLQGALGRFVDELSHSTQTPTDLAGMLVLAVVSAACARKVVVCPHAGYREPVQVFVVCALPPGSRKSEVFRRVAEPLDEAEIEDRRQREAAAAAMAAAGPPPEDKKRGKKGDAPEPAPGLRLYIDDATPEVVTMRLSEQGGRLAILSPEGGGLFEMMAGRYTEKLGANIGVYLAGHAGDRIVVDRIGRPTLYIAHPALTIGLATQPSTLQTLTKKELRGRGLIARFLFSVPTSNIGFRAINAAPVSRESRDGYLNIIRALLAIPVPVGANDRPEPHVIDLDEGARDVFRDFAERMEERQRPNRDLANMPEWSSKLVGATLRIAGLLHMADYALDGSPWEIRMDAETLLRAIHFTEAYLVGHARIAFDAMADTDAIDVAKRLVAWVQRGMPGRKAEAPGQFSVRDAQRAIGGKGTRGEVIDPALDVLLTHGWVRVAEYEDTPNPKGGQPRGRRFEVHPQLVAATEASS